MECMEFKNLATKNAGVSYEVHECIIHGVINEWSMQIMYFSSKQKSSFLSTGNSNKNSMMFMEMSLMTIHEFKKISSIVLYLIVVYSVDPTAVVLSDTIGHHSQNILVLTRVFL